MWAIQECTDSVTIITLLSEKNNSLGFRIHALLSSLSESLLKSAICDGGTTASTSSSFCGSSSSLSSSLLVSAVSVHPFLHRCGSCYLSLTCICPNFAHFVAVYTTSCCTITLTPPYTHPHLLHVPVYHLYLYLIINFTTLHSCSMNQHY